jgi:hypothetical protein
MSVDNLYTVSENYAKESTGSAYRSDFSVSFRKAPNFELMLIGAELHQEIETHDVLILTFKGKPRKEDTSIVSGDPVKFDYSSGATKSTFEGYVYEIDPASTMMAHVTQIWCASASSVLKDSTQEIYKKVTADQVVAKIAKRQGLKSVSQRHPRLRETIVQAGQTDWQLLRRLAKQTGFALKAENTTIFFMSKNKIFQDKKDKAPYFKYKDGITKQQRSVGTCLEFRPVVSDDAIELGVRVDRVMSGISGTSGGSITTTHPNKVFDTAQSRGKVVPNQEYFDGI